MPPASRPSWSACAAEAPRSYAFPMAVALHQITAAIYLAASILSGVAGSLPDRRLQRGALGALALGAIVHGLAFSQLHTAQPTPPINDPAAAVSFMAWVGTLAFLILIVALRLRLEGLTVLVAPISFVAVFTATLGLPSPASPSFGGSGSWPHFHVLMSSAGLSLLGLAAMSGALFLAEHRRLKSKRSMAKRFPMPSLEALDRTNAVSLALGFLLLTLGVVTGMLWVRSVTGHWWQANVHQALAIAAWAIYALLAGARFASNQGARQAAASAVAGFAFLFFAVIGVEIFA